LSEDGEKEEATNKIDEWPEATNNKQQEKKK
jgi:hypothetical protein